MNAHVRLSPGKYRLTVEDYLFLDRTGAFESNKTELVDGEVFIMSPEWRPHIRIKSELFYRLRRAVEEAGLPYFVGSEGSVALSKTDMPQPDILLTSDIAGEGAVPHDTVPLIVEVSSSSLVADLGVKAQRYAIAGIPEYWVLDVNGRVVHQMWAPIDDGYSERCTAAFGEPLAAVTLDDLLITTEGL